MAAADYYNPGGQQPAGPQPAAVQGGLTPNPPYPLSDLPPPYTPFAEQHNRPHSQPPPQPRPSTADQYRPSLSNYPTTHNGQYLPDKDGRPLPQVNNMYKPADFEDSYRPQQYQQTPPPPGAYAQPQGYVPLAGTPAMQQVYGNGAGSGKKHSNTPGYRARDESRSRSSSRSRERSRHRKHSHRQQAQRKKSSGVNTFLGAGGGAIIGDAIFPGLGTIGGALLGGIGGHEYGKSKTRSASNPSRSRRSYDDSYYDEYRRGRKY